MEKSSTWGSSVFVGFLVLLWFGLCAAGFWWLYGSMAVRFDKPELFSATLGMLAWPFVAFVVALPATMVLVSNLRHLAGLKKTIEDAPKNLQTAFDTAENLRVNLQESGVQISNDINGALGEIEARMSAFEGRFGRLLERLPVEEAGAQQLSPRERLAAHLEVCSERFYEVLDAWNGDGRRRGNPLAVTRGGGNRALLVESLRNGRAFDRNNAQLNDAIAEYLSATFRQQLGARRGGVDAEDVDELDGLRQRAEALGARFA